MKRIFITLLALLAMVTGGWAKTVVNVTEQTARVTQYSTLYVGDVVLDGHRSFYYLYSKDLNNSETVFAVVRDCLRDFKGGIFSALVPDIIGQTDDKGVSVCSNDAFKSLMNSYWTDASQAGLACLPNTGVASSSSNDLYQSDAAFAARCTFEENAEIIDNEGYSVTISGPIGKLTSTFTDNVTYSVEDGEMVKHIDRHIDYTCEMITVIYTRAELQSPLTLEAISDGAITFNYNLSLYHDAELSDIEYQKNGDAWTTYTWNDPIAVVTGDKVAFRGNNASYFGNGKGYESRITSTADVYVYGNVMSLINSTDFATLKTLTGKDAFSHLFAVAGENPWEVVSNTTIRNHPTNDLLLPATTLTNMCYMDMFAGCKGLTRAPELPATNMPVACYASMFEGCTGLTVAPALPTTTFTPYGFDQTTYEEYGSIDCYMMMFKDCTSLTEAPALPATTLVHGVYQNMFQGCTSLERAPELPAPIVADNAYSFMFDGCKSLNYVKCLATGFLIDPDLGNTAEDNVMNWLNNVAATGIFVKAPLMNDWTIDSPNGIPAGWTVQNAGEYKVTIAASGIGTFSASENVTVPPGLTAHYCTTFDSDASIMSVTAISDGIIPAETGVLLRGTAGETYTLVATTDAASAISGNALVAVTVPTHVAPTDGDYTNFMLSQGKFIRIADGAANVKMPSNKAYLQILTTALNGNSTSRGISLRWEGDATAIEKTANFGIQNSDIVYDLQGRKVMGKPSRGMYIINGKKTTIR